MRNLQGYTFSWCVHTLALLLFMSVSTQRACAGGTVPFEFQDIGTSFPWPTRVQVTRLDADQDADLVVVHSHALIWHDNIGGDPPTFIEREIPSVESFAESLACADLNGDGRQDVITGAFSGTRWYRNDGNVPPTFTELDVWAQGSAVFGVATTDLDNDMDIDVVAMLYNDDTIAWYENKQGDGSVFVEHIISDTYEQAYRVTTGDLDGDGDQDVAPISLQGPTAWFENDGNTPPQFIPRYFGLGFGATGGLHLADVNGDMSLDVVGAGEVFYGFSDALVWLENNGEAPPAFSSHNVDVSVDPLIDVVVADIDGDRDADLVSGGIWGIAWFENDGATVPSFTEHVLGDELVYSVSVGDVDGNGTLDIAAVFLAKNSVVLYRNMGLAVTSASSLLTHGTADSFEEMAVDLVATNGVEPRRGGPTKLALTLSADLDPATINDAAVAVSCDGQAAGAFTVTAGPNAGAIVVEFNEPLADGACCTLRFPGLLSTEGVRTTGIFRVYPLAGDLNGSGGVTGGDAVLIKPHFGEHMWNRSLSAAQWDFNRDGAVTGGDFALIKPLLGNQSPDCP